MKILLIFMILIVSLLIQIIYGKDQRSINYFLLLIPIFIFYYFHNYLINK